MKFTKNLLTSAVVASVFAAAAIVPVAQAEVSGSVGVASTYLWRGSDLGSGTPAVSGDINYSASGFTAGIWGSSGDAAAGTEYDLYVGYSGAVEDFSYGFTLYNYVYPTGPGYDDDGETDMFEWADAAITLGYGPVSFSAFIPVGKENSSGDYMYYTLSGSVGKFSATLGLHADAPAAVVGCPAGEAECSPVHINLDYAYNDNLTFTLSQFIADESETDDLKFVVSYSLPIGE